ncbi:MAG: gliding motility protein GldN [Flavobacteriales bacterium]|nr:gliding motility protein GldN [Flavobacteriales bacterium]
MNGTIVPYAPLREADVVWERRVWRVLDLSADGNVLFRDPQGPNCMGLFDVVRYALLEENSITAYDAGPAGDDDAFRVPFAPMALVELLAGSLEDGDPVVSRFMIKEDWIFDKQRSEMVVRIIGLAPMREVRGEEGELRGHQVMCWLYYPECRLTFARWAADREVNGERLSYEDLFSQRRFTSTVVKVSGEPDRAINAYRTGLDALLRSEETKEQLLHMGFDLWEY